MRASAAPLLFVLPACLALVAAAAPPLPPPPPEPAPPEPLPAAPQVQERYSPTTQATLEWLAKMEAERAAEPHLDNPAADLAPGAPRATGIQHCTGADGSNVFTDRTCAELGAVSAPPPGVAGANTRIQPRTCARTRQALLEGVRGALEARDANLLAAYYHWTGMGTRAGYDLLDRLDGFTHRPFVDASLATSAERAASVGDLPGGWWPSLSDSPTAMAPAPRPPDLVRVDQMRAYGDVSAEVTYFHVRANAGCWWIQF